MTIERAVETSGVGLHSGVAVKMRLEPAPAGTGIVFRRTDLGGFEVPANWQYVQRVSYATSLMRQGVLISTTEHLLSVLHSVGLDNVYIDIDNLEVPILDGSGLPFVKMIEQAGLKKTRRRRRYLKILRKAEVETPGKRISIEPSERFDIECEVFFDHPLVGRQRRKMSLPWKGYASEIAPARTFGFAGELEQMRNMGLIRGATLDSAVCFEPDRVLNPGGLRFEDEPCRHKILDLIGDLALLGRQILGKVKAERAGHAMHYALVAKIMSDSSLYEVVTPQSLPQSVDEAALVR